MDSILLVLFLIALFIIGFLLYTLFNRPPVVKDSQVMNELPTPAIIPVQHWGYGWRPWWRRHGGLPGLKPVPPAILPKPPKPIIIPGAP